MKITSNIIGVSKTVASVALLKTSVQSSVRTGMMQTVLIIVKRAKENLAGKHAPTPRRHWVTGNLARSIRGLVKMKGISYVEGIVGTDVPYAPHIEANPDGGFLIPAAKTESKEAKRFFVKQIQAAIKGASL